MSIYEYDEEETMRQLREESYEEGEAAGIAKGEATEQKRSIRLLIENCQRLGESPEDTISWIQKQYPVTMEEIKQIMKDSF